MRDLIDGCFRVNEFLNMKPRRWTTLLQHQFCQVRNSLNCGNPVAKQHLHFCL